MKNSGFVWECKCGNIAYGTTPPEECEKCDSLGKFVRIPEDMVEEKEAEAILSLQLEGEEDED